MSCWDEDMDKLRGQMREWGKEILMRIEVVGEKGLKEIEPEAIKIKEQEERCDKVEGK